MQFATYRQLFGEPVIGRRLSLFCVKHARLELCDNVVSTSPVQSYDEVTGVITTMNTQYRPE